jgi:GDP-mannose 4,6-dehydratase|tara:strand:- start:1423 stop:2400 length:978 start_codon:yes stop_codon:yes gene_type:complete
MTNILITGGTGFVGSHMIDFILNNETDVKIYATKRWMEDTKNVDHINDDRFEFIDCDLLDGMSVRRAVEVSKPDKVFHFAAQSFPEVSFKIPVITLQTNVVGTTQLLESIKESDYDPVIISVSSSEVYGNPREGEVPIKENNPIRPANPYSISKVGHDLMSQYYHSAYGMKIIVTRMFSHEGARRGKQFALSSFAYQIVKNEKIPFYDYDCEIRHGNLNSVRTYNHIEDAIRAYWLCSESQRYGEVYNIGGDYTCTVGDALDMLISKSTISDALNKVLDPKRVRPTDITLQIPSSEKFKKHFGWKPEKDLTHICDDLLNYWREVL